MGCDIHMYVEYTNKERKAEQEAKNEEVYWKSFGGRIDPGRNYPLFGYLAGVRYDNPKALNPKGLPKNLGWVSKNDSRVCITEDGEAENCATLESAMNWAKYGCKIYNDDSGKPILVDNPDWHSRSWLTTQEFDKILKLYARDKQNWGSAIEYKALLAAMKSLERGGTIEARVVFWFDN